MKNRLFLLLLFAILTIAIAPACNKGYGCEATEKMKSPYNKKSHKKKKKNRNKGKTQSGLMGYQVTQFSDVAYIDS